MAKGERALGTGGPASEMTREFLAEIIDRVAHPIFVKDRDFRWVVLNHAFCDMVGYPREALLGKGDYDFFPRAEADFFRQKDEEMFATSVQVTIEEEPITDAQGRRHTLATTKVPLRDDDGRITHLVGIIHDITRLKAAEEELRHVNEELERRVSERTQALEAAQEELVRKERLAVLGQLTGGLAHQIRNPLGSIANAAYVLKRGLGKGASEDLGHAVAIILEEAWRANRLISDLLDYARVRPPMPTAVSTELLVQRVIAEHAFPESIQVAIDAPAEPKVAVDFEQVLGALDNLVRNAIEAMPEGGTLQIEAHPVGERMRLCVTDTGGGVAPEIRRRLFEPLVTSKPLGRGLGLTTARALIENQGGSLACEDGPSGARFAVELPLAP